MSTESYTASAPGSLMLFGEHAVLRNRYAIACAINQRITATVTPRKDRELHLDSSLGSWHGPLDALPDDEPFRFVHAAITNQRNIIPGGFDLRIESEFSHEVGFASSAAVTAATVAALQAWRGSNRDRYALFHTCRNIIRAAQNGVGSGADLAACIFGGVVAYRAEPFFVDQLSDGFPISVIYSGTKVATPEVIDRIKRLEERYPAQVKDLLLRIGDITEEAARCMRTGDFESIGDFLQMNQGLMVALGLNTPVLAKIALALREQPDVIGSKISGAGLGDCVVALGTDQAEVPGYERIDVAITPQGLDVGAA